MAAFRGLWPGIPVAGASPGKGGWQPGSWVSVPSDPHAPPPLPLPSAAAGEGGEPWPGGCCVHSLISQSGGPGAVGSTEKCRVFAVLVLPGNQSHLSRRPPGSEPAAQAPALGEEVARGGTWAMPGQARGTAGEVGRKSRCLPSVGRFVQGKLRSPFPPHPNSHQVGSVLPCHPCSRSPLCLSPPPAPPLLCLDFYHGLLSSPLPSAVSRPLSGSSQTPRV